MFQSQDSAPPDWYSSTRVSKKLRSFFRSIISLIHGNGFSSFGNSASSPIWVARRFDVRILLLLGLLAFALAALLGTRITNEWRLNDFIPIVLLQSVGQSFTLLPIILIALAYINEGLAREENAKDAEFRFLRAEALLTEHVLVSRARLHAALGSAVAIPILMSLRT